jgi:hypothetical protein
MSLEELSSLSLFPATPEQIVVARRRGFLEWGRGLTQEQYFQWDNILEVLQHASNGKMATWCDNPVGAVSFSAI